MTIPIPNLNLSAGGGTSRADNSAGLQLSSNSPFDFDHSGWVVNFGDGATVRAEGNSGANQTAQTPSGAGGAGLLSGINPVYIGAALAVLFLMRR